MMNEKSPYFRQIQTERLNSYRFCVLGQAKNTFGDFAQWNTNWDAEITVAEVNY